MSRFVYWEIVMMKPWCLDPHWGRKWRYEEKQENLKQQAQIQMIDKYAPDSWDNYAIHIHISILLNPTVHKATVIHILVWKVILIQNIQCPELKTQLY